MSPASRSSVALSTLPLVLAGLLLAALVTTRRVEPLPVLGELPSFVLTDQDGRPFGTQQVAGRVWVANFIFTRCTTICPTFTERMRQIQEETAEHGIPPYLVSISVDPEYDQPDVLRAYAAEHHADLSRWTFLTGDHSLVKETVKDGFKMAMEPGADPSEVLHGYHFVLVDDRLRIRGYYDSQAPDVVQVLLRDLDRL